MNLHIQLNNLLGIFDIVMTSKILIYIVIN